MVAKELWCWLVTRVLLGAYWCADLVSRVLIHRSEVFILTLILWISFSRRFSVVMGKGLKASVKFHGLIDVLWRGSVWLTAFKAQSVHPSVCLSFTHCDISTDRLSPRLSRGYFITWIIHENISVMGSRCTGRDEWWRNHICLCNPLSASTPEWDLCTWTKTIDRWDLFYMRWILAFQTHAPHIQISKRNVIISACVG